MALRLVQVNLKARDDVAVGQFWAQAFGWVARSPVRGATSAAPAGFVWTDPEAAVCIDVIAVADLGTVRGRAHVELATTSAAHRAELIDRLLGLGATPVDETRKVLADPEGNLFCVLAPQHSPPGAGPIAAVVLDCADPRALARFWGETLNWVEHETSDEQATLRPAKGAGPWLTFTRTPHLPTGGHRAHLDVAPYGGAEQAAEVARLRAAGATPADVGQGDVSWVVLADPEGNEFCVLAPG